MVKLKENIIAVTGASGFVGSHLAKRLINCEYRVKGLTHSPKKAKLLEKMGCEAFIGDITRPESLKEFLRDADALVHLAAIIRESGEETFESVNYLGTKRLVEEARRSKVSKIIFMSVLGSSPYAKNPILGYKWLVEEEVRKSGIPYVIFRSSLIIGPGGDMTNKIADIARKPLVILPRVEVKLQPIYVKDVASFIVRAIEEDKFSNRMFEIGGPDRVNLREIVEMFAEALGMERKMILGIPSSILKPFVWICEKTSERPLISSNELNLLQVDLICEPSIASKEFNLKLTPIKEVLTEIFSERAERKYSNPKFDPWQSKLCICPSKQTPMKNKNLKYERYLIS